MVCSFIDGGWPSQVIMSLLKLELDHPKHQTLEQLQLPHHLVMV